MLIKPIGAIDPFWAPDDGAPAGGGEAPAEAGQAAAEPAGTTPSAPEGQVAAQAPAAEAGQVAGNEGNVPEQPSFFEYEWEDGHKDVHATEQDHRNAWREGILRRDKFSQKTEELARQREELQGNQSRYDAEYTQFLQQKQKQDDMVSELDGLSEPEFQQLISQVTKGRQGPQAQRVPKEVQEELAASREFRETYQADLDKQSLIDNREAVYDQLGKELGEDFKRDDVQAEIERLRSVDEAEQIREFSLLVHHALIGKTKPMDLAKQAQDAARNKNTLPQAPAGGAAPPLAPGDSTGVLTETEAEAMDMNDVVARAKKQAGVK